MDFNFVIDCLVDISREDSVIRSYKPGPLANSNGIMISCIVSVILGVNVQSNKPTFLKYLVSTGIVDVSKVNSYALNE